MNMVMLGNYMGNKKNARENLTTSCKLINLELKNKPIDIKSQ